MTTTIFKEYSETQVFVQHTMKSNDIEEKNTLYINIDSSEPKTTLTIEDETTDSIDGITTTSESFEIDSKHLQQVVDWLRKKQIIK